MVCYMIEYEIVCAANWGGHESEWWALAMCKDGYLVIQQAILNACAAQGRMILNINLSFLCIAWMSYVVMAGGIMQCDLLGAPSFVDIEKQQCVTTKGG